MPSYPYEPGCESRTDSLLTPGMDNTRHFYSITAVAGTVFQFHQQQRKEGREEALELQPHDHSYDHQFHLLITVVLNDSSYGL